MMLQSHSGRPSKRRNSQERPLCRHRCDPFSGCCSLGEDWKSLMIEIESDDEKYHL